MWLLLGKPWPQGASPGSRSGTSLVRVSPEKNLRPQDEYTSGSWLSNSPPCNKGLQRGLSEGRKAVRPPCWFLATHGPAWGSMTEKQGKLGTAWLVLGGPLPNPSSSPTFPLLMLSPHRLPLSWPAGSSWPRRSLWQRWC